jgi:CRISPR-associated protein Csb2
MSANAKLALLPEEMADPPVARRDVSPQQPRQPEHPAERPSVPDKQTPSVSEKTSAPKETWRSPRRRRRIPAKDNPARFTVARFVLAGRPPPRIEDAVKIGELMRLAALAQFGWTKDEATGRSRPNAPWVISGRDAENRPLRNPEHRHAFWLPEDADGDGEIDHVVVYAQEGFCSEVRRKLDRLTKLWIEPAKRIGGDSDADQPEARQEWRLALEGFGRPADFADASSLLGKTRTWESVTPFLAAGHLKAGGYPAEIRRLVSRREFPDATEVMPLRPKPIRVVRGRRRSGQQPRRRHRSRPAATGRPFQSVPLARTGRTA